MKTSELTGAALDWAVAKCESYPVSMSKTGYLIFCDPLIQCGPRGTQYSPSTNWAQGGPIIEREGISVAYDVELSQAEGSEYWATIYAVDSGDGRIYGPTPLIAAMRCYVASKLGDDIEIPKELT
jgi:hypothetical protein